MLTCENKTFNRFLFFSLLFFSFSLLINTVIVQAASPGDIKLKSTPDIKQTNKIQIEQKKIINHLQRIEDKMVVLPSER